MKKISFFFALLCSLGIFTFNSITAYGVWNDFGETSSTLDCSGVTGTLTVNVKTTYYPFAKGMTNSFIVYQNGKKIGNASTTKQSTSELVLTRSNHVNLSFTGMEVFEVDGTHMVLTPTDATLFRNSSAKITEL